MMKTFISDISGRKYPVSEKVSGGAIRDSVLDFIRRDYPDFSSDNAMSFDELNVYREKYISDYLASEMGQLSELDKKVIESIKEGSVISDITEDNGNSKEKMGARVADNVAKFGGSWTFILSFLGFLVFWICLNAFWFANQGYDPYPFILLNLILSCLAALQAPIIMMSQNRQEAKDRERSKEDYMVNLKAELEVRALHEKVDHMMMNQQQELIEIQKIQIDMLNDIIRNVGRQVPERKKKTPAKKVG